MSRTSKRALFCATGRVMYQLHHRNGQCLSVQTLENFDHSTAHQEQTQLFSAPPKLAQMRGSQHLASLLPGQGQPYQMHTNVLLVPSACAGFSSGRYCILDHSLTSRPLEQNLGVLPRSVPHSATKWYQVRPADLLSFMFWARNGTEPLEVILGIGVLMCTPKGIPVILPLSYLLLLPLHLLQLVLQHALCSETMPGPL